MLGVFKLAAEFANVPAALLLGLCSAESDFRAIANPMDGGSASLGVCQTKLSTARMESFEGSAQQLLENPLVNAIYAAKYLSRQIRRYDGDICSAIAAYNRGTAKRLEDGSFSNQRYVNRVISRWKKYDKKAAMEWAAKCEGKSKDAPWLGSI
jgi:soluble lytic murein transglycosylase-like protein